MEDSERKYRQSAKGKEALKRAVDKYRLTEKGKKAFKRALTNYRKTHKEEYNAYQREYYHSPKGQEYEKQYYSANRKILNKKSSVNYSVTKHNPRRKYASLKAVAKYRDIPFELSFEEYALFTQENCVYCHSSFKSTCGGLDRKDNNKGYNKDNVVACCKRCNRRKGTKSYEDFTKSMEL